MFVCISTKLKLHSSWILSSTSLCHWAVFQGEHPFHNYTIRSKYRKQLPQIGSSGNGSVSKRAKYSYVQSGFESEESDEDDIHGANESFATEFGERKHNSPSPSSDGTSAGVFDEDEDNLKEQNPILPVLARWLDEPDEKDRLSASHFRKIFRCCCGKLEQLSGVNYVEISICGESFMLHQVSFLYFHWMTLVFFSMF